MKNKKISKLYDNKYDLIEGKTIIPKRYLIIKNEIITNYKGKKKILDIGCGEGQLLIMLKGFQYQLYGIDVSKNAIEICKKQGLDVYQKDIENETNFLISVDIIISADTIEHILDFYKFFNYINKSLTKSGIFIIATPNSNRIDYILKYIKGRSPTSLQNPLHIRFFSPNSLIEIADSQGFKLVRNLSLSIFPNHPLLSKILMKRKSLATLLSEHIILVFQKVANPKFENINEVMNLLRRKWYEDYMIRN